MLGLTSIFDIPCSIFDIRFAPALVPALTKHLSSITKPRRREQQPRLSLGFLFFYFLATSLAEDVAVFYPYTQRPAVSVINFFYKKYTKVKSVFFCKLSSRCRNINIRTISPILIISLFKMFSRIRNCISG